MAEFDLGNQPPDPRKFGGSSSGGGLPPPPSKGQLPTTRASDLLRARSSGGPTSPGDPDKPGPSADRRATPFDESASGLLVLCSLVFLAGAGWLLWGMWSGVFADPNWGHTYAHADRARAINNIDLCANVMWVALGFATALFLFLFYHEDFAGYSLLAGAAFMLLGIPYATEFIYQNGHFRLIQVTQQVIGIFGNQSWVIGIPGFALSIISIFRATVGGLEQAKAKRSRLQFGQKAVRDHKHRNVFLGACWNLPYCKDGIRARCPIFVKKSGPCWRNKRGCMCDQTILLVAQAPNWKQNVSATIGKLDGNLGMPSLPEMPPQPQLSHRQKVERCRQCVIFNYHQEQKYKLLVGLVLGATVVGLVLFNGPMLAVTGYLFTSANSLFGHFSFQRGATELFPNGAPPFVEWLILSSVLLICVAKILQFAEYVVFRLKL
jgi:hypothetical protein